jgi:hypothetical protein
MFAIRNRLDGSYWMGQPGTPMFPPAAATWSSNWRLARTFEHREDALSTAFLECPTHPLDYDAVEVPVVRLRALVRRCSV